MGVPTLRLSCTVQISSLKSFKKWGPPFPVWEEIELYTKTNPSPKRRDIFISRTRRHRERPTFMHVDAH